jgi:hypothetical protein
MWMVQESNYFGSYLDILKTVSLLLKNFTRITFKHHYNFENYPLLKRYLGVLSSRLVYYVTVSQLSFLYMKSEFKLNTYLSI